MITPGSQRHSQALGMKLSEDLRQPAHNTSSSCRATIDDSHKVFIAPMQVLMQKAVAGLPSCTVVLACSRWSSSDRWWGLFKWLRSCFERQTFTTILYLSMKGKDIYELRYYLFRFGYYSHSVEQEIIMRENHKHARKEFHNSQSLFTSPKISCIEMVTLQENSVCIQFWNNSRRLPCLSKHMGHYWQKAVAPKKASYLQGSIHNSSDSRQVDFRLWKICSVCSIFLQQNRSIWITETVAQ